MIEFIVCFLISLLVYACTSFSDLARASSSGVIMTPSDDSDIESGIEPLENLNECTTRKGQRGEMLPSSLSHSEERSSTSMPKKADEVERCARMSEPGSLYFIYLSRT